MDIEKTKEYYKSNSLCDCDGCQNFYTQIKDTSPELEAFLSAFGVDIAKPDEIPWWDIDENRIIYNPCYTVTGEIKQMGEYEMDFGFINVVISKPDTPWGYIPNEQTEPYFVISVYNVILPWVLDTPFPSSTTVMRDTAKVSIFEKLRNLFRR